MGTTFQDKYLDKNAKMFQGKNVEMFQGRFKERNAEMYPGNSAIMFHAKSVEMFLANNVETYPGNNAKMSQNKNVEMYPDNNVETFQDKYAAKLAMPVNNVSQPVHESMEQTVVIITSPISILLNQFYVLFIVTSSFRL